MSYETTFDVWLSEKLKKVLAIAVLEAAQAVIYENEATENHAARLAWAKAVFADPMARALEMSSVVALNPDIRDGDYTDADVQYVVNGLVNIFASL